MGNSEIVQWEIGSERDKEAWEKTYFGGEEILPFSWNTLKMVSFVKLKTECYTQPHRLVHFSPQPHSVPAALDRFTFSPKLTRPRNIFKIFSWFLRGTANDFFYHDKRSFTSGVLVKEKVIWNNIYKIKLCSFINKT